MAYGFVPLVHLAALVLSVIELGLTAYVVSVYLSGPGYYDDGGFHQLSPSPVNFMVFNSIWSLLVLAYVGLSPLYYTRIFHRLASLALEAATMIFWFAGAIALAVFVGGPYDCSDNSFCGAIEAAVAFGFFLWALFTFLVVLDTIEALRSRRRHTTAKPAAYPGA